jgi:hypothetical protein
MLLLLVSALQNITAIPVAARMRVLFSAFQVP